MTAKLNKIHNTTLICVIHNRIKSEKQNPSNEALNIHCEVVNDLFRQGSSINYKSSYLIENRQSFS